MKKTFLLIASILIASEAYASGCSDTAVNGQSPCGHIVKDSTGATVKQRKYLQFTGSGITSVANSSTNTTVVTVAGASVGGADTQVQYNSSGSLAGDSGFTYTVSTQTANVGTVSAGQLKTTVTTTPATTTTSSMAFDSNAHATGRGAYQVNDGTANTYLVGTLASDTPSNGQYPMWNTGGTITWETVSAGISGTLGASDNYVPRSDGTGGSTLQASTLRSDDNGTLIVNCCSNYISLVPGSTYNTITSVGASSALILNGNDVWLGNSGSGYKLRWYTDDGNNNTQMYPSSGNFKIEQVSSATSKDLILSNPGSGVFGLQVEGAITSESTITSSATGSLGWSVVSGANTACTTTCTSAAVMGFDTASGTTPVGPSDATADVCLCAGAS